MSLVGKLPAMKLCWFALLAAPLLAQDAMKAGKSTVLVASGGVEMNGPYLVTGKL